MVITLDLMSSRYHLLPTEVLKRASTFDLYVMDVGKRYEHIAQQKANGTYIKPVPKLSQKEMEEMIIQANRNNNV